MPEPKNQIISARFATADGSAITISTTVYGDISLAPETSPTHDTDNWVMYQLWVQKGGRTDAYVEPEDVKAAREADEAKAKEVAAQAEGDIRDNLGNKVVSPLS